MSHLIAGIDEALRPGTYLMCASVASTADRTNIAQRMRAMLLPKQRRLHAKRESPGRKRMLIKALTTIPGFTCHVVVAQTRDGLHDLACHVAKLGVAEMVLERIDDGTIARDAELLMPLARRYGFEWRHEVGHHEPLLWISDLVLWAYGAGGEMRKAVEPLIAAVIRPQ